MDQDSESFESIADSVKELFRDLAWNAVAEHFEPPFTVSGGDPRVMRHLQDQLRFAFRTGGQALLDDQYEVDERDVLAAFATIRGLAVSEYVVVALSTPDRGDALTSLFASEGGVHHVSIPTKALRQVDRRIDDKRPFRAVYIHNHPKSLLHDVLGAKLLGPSAQDRTHLLRAYDRWFGTGGVVRSEFYLVEGGTFRKFLLPSAQQAWELASKWGILKH